MSEADVLKRMLDKLPNTQAWFGANKAPTVSATMEIRASEVHELAQLLAWSKKAVFLMESEDDACDMWGRDCEIPRFESETDEVYRARIQKEILRARNTVPGIEDGIEDILGMVTFCYEPWRDVLRFGQHARLGKNKLSGPYYTNAVIDVKMNGYHRGAKDVIDRLRLCGVYPYYTTIFTGGIESVSDYIISGLTIIGDLTSTSRHNTIKAGGIYDGDEVLTSLVKDPQSPPFVCGGICGYDRTYIEEE